MSSPFSDSEGQVRAALEAIVSDPAHGPSALDRPQVMANLLSDYLPDMPRESGLLLAAANAGLASLLRSHVGQGLDPQMAARLAAASLAERTAFTASACEWVTAQIAHAVGIAVTAGVTNTPATAQPTLGESPAQLAAPPLVRPLTGPAHGAGGDDGSAPRRRSTSRRIMVTALAMVVAAAAGTLIAITRHDHAAALVPKVPAPRLAQFVPASQRVLHVYHVDLDRAQVPETAVITTAGSPSAASSYAAEDMLLLAWDKYAHRWTRVYDAARDRINVAYQPDAYTDSFQANNFPAPAPLIPTGLGVASIRLKLIRDEPHGAADLLVTANVVFADGFGQEIAIVHYDGNVATVVWAFVARGGRATVIGPLGHQDVAVTSVWTTASDPQCCPARSYRFVVAKGIGPQGGEYYRVITDDRPWLGAIITEDPPQSLNARAVVQSVVPGSPAAGLLQPGDVLTAINGSSAAGHGLGPAIFDQLAVYKPGQTVSLDLIRRGNSITLRITLGSLADRRAANAGANLASPNGTNAQYML